LRLNLRPDLSRILVFFMIFLRGINASPLSFERLLEKSIEQRQSQQPDNSRFRVFFKIFLHRGLNLFRGESMNDKQSQRSDNSRFRVFFKIFLHRGLNLFRGESMNDKQSQRSDNYSVAPFKGMVNGQPEVKKYGAVAN